jgi:hypothetical protein
MKQWLIAIAAAVVAIPAAAQGSATIVSGTVFAGGRAGGGFTEETANGDRDVDVRSGGAGAVAIDWVIDPARQMEVFVSRQNTELQSVTNSTGGNSSVPLDISYIHLGGTYYWDGSHQRGGPYAVGGFGITHFSPSLSGLTSEVRGSINLGVGYRHVLSPGVSLRMELRGYATFITSSGGFMCSGGCVVQIQGDSFTQAEALIGLSIGY